MSCVVARGEKVSGLAASYSVDGLDCVDVNDCSRNERNAKNVQYDKYSNNIRIFPYK